MGIDRIILLCVGCVLGTVGCVGLFYIGNNIKKLNKTLKWLQEDVAFMKDRKLDARQCMNVITDINRRMCDLLETVAVGSMLYGSVGKDDVPDED